MTARAYVFTLNNPTEEERALLSSIKEPIRYLVWQLEKGEEGTLHIQGYVQVNNAMRLAGIKKLPGLARAHIEKRFGTHEEALNYCTKEDTRVEGPYSYGSPNIQGKRNDLDDLAQTILDGKTPMEIMETSPGLYLRHRDKIQKMHFDLCIQRAPVWRQVLVYILVGASGIGKTRLAVSLSGSFFKITETQQQVWYDGYCNQKVLILDDFDGWIPYRMLLSILDGYSLRLPVKGAFSVSGWNIVIITSNTYPETWYTERQVDLAPLKRRVSKQFDCNSEEDISNAYQFIMADIRDEPDISI